MTIGKPPCLLSASWQSESLELELISKEILLEHIKRLGISPIYWQSADNVTFGLYTGDDFIFADYTPEWKHLQELRVFNAESELHIWKYKNSYSGRWIKNETAAPDASGNCLEQTVKLWGTLAKPADRFIILSESRGMELALPIVWEDRYAVGINAFLRERFYLKEDASGCAYITDRRFCGILIADGNGKLVEVGDYMKMAVFV